MVSQDTLTALGAVLEEHELLELIEQSESEDDPQQFLDEHLAELTANGKCNADEVLEKWGLSVEQNFRHHVPTNGPAEHLPHGYKIVMQKETGQNFTGVTLTWQRSPYIVAPFENEADAKAGALSMAYDMEKSSYIRSLAIRMQLIKMPVARVEKPSKGQKVQTVLTADQIHRLEALNVALRAQNAQVEPGKPINSYADVVRWMINQLSV